MTQEWRPSVSAVIPTRDRTEELLRAVTAVVGQTYAGSLECIVVFDQCEPMEIAIQLPARRAVRAIRNDRTPGLAGARNTGILAADGELIGFCDDDDEWLPDKIRLQVGLLEDKVEARVVGCDVELRDGDRTFVRRVPDPPIGVDQLVRSRVWELHPGTVLVRRTAILDEIGLVDEDLPGSYAEDYDWLLRAARFGPIPVVGQPLLRVNWHGGSFFGRRWQTIIEAYEYLLTKHPEFAAVPAGMARLEGQIAFAHGALGHRKEARRWALRALRHNWREKRAVLALGVSSGLVSAETILAMAQSRGRGV